MDFLVDRLRFLGLNEREVRVFTALSTFGRMNMTKVAARAGVARTTVDAIIRRLVEQGLVTQSRVENHYEYSVELEKVADTLDWIEQRLRPKDGTKNLDNPTSYKNDDKFVKIDDNCSIQDSFSQRAGDRSRVLLARTPEGLQDALRRLTEYVRHSATTGRKLEILTCSHVADAVKEVGVQGISWDNPNLIRLNVVPSSYCRTESDIVIFPDRALARNIHTNEVKVVRDADVVEAMKHMIDIACETGWSVNLSAWVATGGQAQPEAL